MWSGLVDLSAAPAVTSASLPAGRLKKKKTVLKHFFYFLGFCFSMGKTIDFKSMGKTRGLDMGKLQLTGQYVGRVFNSRSGCMCPKPLFCYEAKQPNLKLKTQPKQLFGSLPIAFALPSVGLVREY
jgi:hypothetical protein